MGRLLSRDCDGTDRTSSTVATALTPPVPGTASAPPLKKRSADLPDRQSRWQESPAGMAMPVEERGAGRPFTAYTESEVARP